MSKRLIAKYVKYFNIHNLVKIKIQSELYPKIDEVIYQIREFEVPHLSEEAIDIFIYDYSKCPIFKNCRIASNYYYYSAKYLNIPADRFCFNLIDTPLIIYCDIFRIPLNFLIELVLLDKGYSFIHSAAVECQGKSYLFPAFRGTRKTTTIAAIVYDGGKLFGDDMNIIKEREILNYPSDLSVYPYHLAILEIKDGKMEFKFNIAKIVDSIVGIISKLLKYNSRVRKLLTLVLNSIKTSYINVSPKRVFGKDCIAEKGQIDEIYYLCGVESDSPTITIERVEANDLAETCVNILFQEWYQSMPILYTYSALSAFSVDSLFSKIRDIFRHTFMHYECYQIKIPNNLDNLTYQEQMISILIRN